MANAGTRPKWGTKHRTKTNKTKTTQNTKIMVYTNPIKTQGCTQVIAKDNQFLFLVRHPLLIVKFGKNVIGDR